MLLELMMFPAKPALFHLLSLKLHVAELYEDPMYGPVDSDYPSFCKISKKI